VNDRYPGRNHQKNVKFYVHLNWEGSHSVCSVILKTYEVVLDICGQLLLLFQTPSWSSFRDMSFTKVGFLKKLWIFFAVWLAFTLSRYVWHLWKADNLKIEKVRIFWFLFQIFNFLSFGDITLVESGRSGRFGPARFILEIFTIYIQIKLLSLHSLVIISLQKIYFTYCCMLIHAGK